MNLEKNTQQREKVTQQKEKVTQQKEKVTQKLKFLKCYYQCVFKRLCKVEPSLRPGAYRH